MPEIGAGAERAPLVLVVDDNRDSRDLYAVWLTMLGCRVLAADDGRQALRLARACRPDLVISDISMPVMDGCMLIQLLRADERTRGIPAVAVTGFGSAWHEAARDCGFDVVLAKPTELPDFEQAVARFTSSAALAAPR